MCLITTKSIPEIAQENVICYKFYKLMENKLFSPYQGVLAPNINEVVNTVLGRAYLHRYRGKSPIYSINRGFHSFKYFEELIGELHFWKCSDIRIFKCIIPQGTKYYKGKFHNFPSYCSESIKLIKLIRVCV